MRLLFAFLYCLTASAADIYFAQASAGSNNGTSCANAYSVTRFNTADSNWTAGNILHLCGTFTGTGGATMLTTQGSGSSGNPITIKFEPGSGLTAPYWGSSINGAINVLHNYITIDGGGNGTATSVIGAGSGASSIVSTANGDSLANSQASIGIAGTNCDHVVIKNFIVGPIYIHTEDVNNASGASTSDINLSGCTNALVSHNTTLDAQAAMGGGDNGATMANFGEFSFNLMTNCNRCMVVGTATQIMSNVLIHDNDFAGGAYLWDQPDNAFHHNAVHAFNTTSGHINNVQLYNNYVHGIWGKDAISNHTTSMFFLETLAGTGADVLVYNNLLTPADQLSMPTNGMVFCKISNQCDLYNNTIIGINNGLDFGTAVSCNTPQNVALNNNTIAYMTAYFNCAFTADYNIYSGVDTNGWDGNTFAAWQGLGNDTHGSTTTNIMVDGAFKPVLGSPLIGAGLNLTSLSIGPLDLDKAGISRPPVAAWDVGAYQFVAASCGSYSHCRTITFDHAKAGSSDTSNYVALISGNYTYLAVTGSGGFVQHTTTQTPGGATITVPADVVYTSDQGCSLLLKWEYETYSSTTGTIRAHVNIGTLSHTVDTTIYECAGNAGVTTWQGDVPGTWVNYMLVQHLPDGSTLTAKDSAHSNNGTIVGATATTGQIDGAGSFPGGAGNLITVSDNASLSNPAGPLTMSGWYNAAIPTTDDGGIVQKSPNLTQGEYFLGPLGSFGNRIYCFILDQTTGGYIGRFSSQPPAGWHYIVCTYNGGTTNSSVGIWSDGVQIDTNNFGSGTFVQMRDTTQPVLIGGAHSAIGGPLTAVADEIRVSSVDRTGSITAEYNNQLNPLTFYTVGPDLAPSSSARRRMLL